MAISEEEESYYINRDKFPDDLRSYFDYVFALKEMHYHTEPEFLETIDPPLKKLMQQQYPDFQNITDPVQKEHMGDINSLMTFFLIWQMFHLIEDQKKGIDWLKKYPELERWRAFYCQPAKPYVVDDSNRNKFLYPANDLADKEWELHKEEENNGLLQLHKWEQSRKQAFYDMIQPLLFNRLPELQDLEGDSWVIYAMILGDRYDEWKTFCERLETIINYELPADSFYWDQPEFRKAIHEKGPEYLNRSSEKRGKRIDEFVWPLDTRQP